MRFFLAALLLWVSATPLWADCKLGKLGDVKAIVAGLRLYVPGKVNGTPVLFIVDTGADTMLFRDAALEIGVSMGGKAGESYGLTGHEATDSRATVESLEIGQATRHNFSLRAVGPGGDRPYNGVPVIGLLGEDILSHFDIEINLKEGQFSLYQPVGCDGSNLAYWTDNYNLVDMIRYSAREPRIKLEGKLDDRAITLELDTGSPFSIMSQSLAASRGVTPETPGVQSAGEIAGIHGEAQPAWVGTFQSFTLDQERIAPAKIEFFRFTQGEARGGSRLSRSVIDVDMLLGLDFLRAHRMLISHSQQKIYFSYTGGPPFSALKPRQAPDPIK